MSALTYSSSEFFRTKYKLVPIHVSKVPVLFIHSIIKFSKAKLINLEFEKNTFVFPSSAY